MVSHPGFDRWADTYERSPMQRWLFEEVHRAVLQLASRLPTPESILDVGCGTGKLLRTLGAYWRGAALYGVDPATRMIGVARARGTRASLWVAPAEDLPLPDGSMSLVVSTMSFHHWQNRTRGLQEIARVLKPGGYMMLADLAGPPWLSRLLKDPLYGRAPERERLLQIAGIRLIAHHSIRHEFLLLTIGQRPSIDDSSMVHT